jgi:hypothetical protein
MSNSKKWVDLGLSYAEALHAMQSGVAYAMETGMDDDITLKHLRVGVNSALIDSGAIANLLIKKDVITHEEFHEELRLAMNHEVHIYEELLGVKFR